MHGEVTVHMHAAPEAVWDLVSDVTRIGEFSPETFEAEWLGGATGPAVGARFRGHVKRNERGPTYWAECEVTECVPNEVFGFTVGPSGRVLNTWKYELAASDGGTDVTESFRLPDALPTRIYWALAGRFRGRRNVNDMRRTLERMRAVVEA